MNHSTKLSQLVQIQNLPFIAFDSPYLAGITKTVAVEHSAQTVTMDSVEKDDEPLVFKQSKPSSTSHLENVNQLMKVEKPLTSPIVRFHDFVDLEDDDDQTFDEDDIGHEDNYSDEEDDYAKYVCEICDDGGTILWHICQSHIK